MMKFNYGKKNMSSKLLFVIPFIIRNLRDRIKLLTLSEINNHE